MAVDSPSSGLRGQGARLCGETLACRVRALCGYQHWIGHSVPRLSTCYPTLYRVLHPAPAFAAAKIFISSSEVELRSPRFYNTPFILRDAHEEPATLHVRRGCRQMELTANPWPTLNFIFLSSFPLSSTFAHPFTLLYLSLILFLVIFPYSLIAFCLLKDPWNAKWLQLYTSEQSIDEDQLRVFSGSLEHLFYPLERFVYPRL